jgi:uncharacterized protein
MAEHPNVARIKDLYAAFDKGDFAVLNDGFAADLVWHEGGRNQLTGDHRGREAVFRLFGKLMELTEGSFHLEVHGVLADDEHAVALVGYSASRGARSVKASAVDVMRLRDGKVVEGWTLHADQYAFDEVFG